MGVAQQLTEHWYRERSRASPLAPLAWLYGAAVAARRSAYTAGWRRRASPGRPVVVIGNLTVGGTGKTPLTVWLARALGAAGLRVGIISRGYGRSSREPRLVEAGASWREVGDEPLLLARRSGCPTAVAADRLAAARLLAARVDVLLADDGLQHLALARDCEIVVIDGARGFGNGRLLPAGPLREPLRRLGQADAVIVNGPPTHGSLAALVGSRTMLRMSLAAHEALRLDGGAAPCPLDAFRGQRVHAVAGIGHPARFFAALEARGIELIAHPYADHHALIPAELEFGDGLPVLMTEKDAVKCTAIVNPRLWYVPVEAQFDPADATTLLACVQARVRAAAGTGGR